MLSPPPYLPPPARCHRASDSIGVKRPALSVPGRSSPASAGEADASGDRLSDEPLTRRTNLHEKKNEIYKHLKSLFSEVWNRSKIAPRAMVFLLPASLHERAAASREAGHPASTAPSLPRLYQSKTTAASHSHLPVLTTWG